MKPHKQSDYMIGYPVDKQKGRGIVRLFIFLAACAFIAWKAIP